MARRTTKKKPTKQPEQPTRRGPKGKYTDGTCDQAIASGRMGASKAQIARDLGVSRDTIHEWTRTKPEFAAAMKEAIELSMAWWEDQGQNSLWADKFNSTAFIFQMKNRFREDYAEISRTELTGKDGGAIETKETSDLEVARRVAFMLSKAARIVDSGTAA